MLTTVLQSRTGFAQSTPPELPRSYVDTTLVAPTGRTIAVRAGGDFQAALNAAAPGDVITLEAGASFPPVILPNKSGAGWITIRTSAPDSSLPLPGTRIDPSYAAVMPKIMADTVNTPAVQTARGAHHYRFIGVEFKPPTGTYVHSLVMIGGSTPDFASLAQLPHHIIFDRSYVHGDPREGGGFGIRLNGTHLAVIDSYVADFKGVGVESKALAASNTPGPIKIVNNYLEAAAVNVMFGGSDAVINGVVPSDIEIRRNLFTKQLSWKIGDPSYAGVPFSVKNLFELKSAQRVLIEGNVFTQNWGHAQAGYAIVFTVRSGDEGRVPWSTVSDIAFTNNIVRGAGGGFQLVGVDHQDGFIYPTNGMHRVAIANNLFEDINAARWNAVNGANGHFALILSAIGSLVFDHNTVFNSGAAVYFGGLPDTNFVFRNNIVPQNNACSVRSDTTFCGTATLNAYAPGYVFTKTAIWGASQYQSDYPPGNFYLASVTDVGFANPVTGGDYHLAASSPFRNAGTDGKDLGVDFNTLVAALGGDAPDPTPSTDTTRPSVSITAPMTGATVSGVVTVAVSATDDVGVTTLEYRLNGSLIAVVAPPTPTFSLDTTAIPDGVYGLTVSAFDAAGNNAQAAASLTVRNSPISSPVLAVATTTATAGTPVTVTLTNGFGGETDWLALAPAGAPDTTYLQWTYVGAGVGGRTWTVILPFGWPSYEFRLFANDGWTLAATSSAVTVANSSASALTVNATRVRPGGRLTVTLTNGPGGATDWLALTPVGAEENAYLQWVYVGAGRTTRRWTLTMPTELGSYEVRLFPNDGHIRSATSPTVTVAQ